MQKGRVLVIDDEPAIGASTAAVLQELGYEARHATVAASVPAIVREWVPDTILQDVRMPGLHLGRFVREVRAALPAVRIVLFSASADVQEMARTLDVDGWLEKPFRAHELLAAVARRAGARAEARAATPA